MTFFHFDFHTSCTCQNISSSLTRCWVFKVIRVIFSLCAVLFLNSTKFYSSNVNANLSFLVDERNKCFCRQMKPLTSHQIKVFGSYTWAMTDYPLRLTRSDRSELTRPVTLSLVCGNILASRSNSGQKPPRAHVQFVPP